jgi:hypothetical protein
LKIAVEGGVFVMAPDDVIDGVRGAARGPRGRKVDFDFRDVSASAVLLLVDDVNRRPRVEPHVAGTLCATLRDADSLVVKRIIERAVTVTQSERQVPTRRMPPAPPLDARACEPTAHGDLEPPTLVKVSLPCVLHDGIDVVAIVSRGDSSLAAVRNRVAGRGLVELVRKNEFVGDPATRIEAIEPGAVVLDGGKRLPLAR